jgi:hypothetical protein
MPAAAQRRRFHTLDAAAPAFDPVGDPDNRPALNVQADAHGRSHEMHRCGVTKNIKFGCGFNFVPIDIRYASPSREQALREATPHLQESKD